MPRRLTKRVLLVAWPGAQWKPISGLIDAGLLPNLQALVEDGVLAFPSALAPAVAPAVYTSLITGYRADQHRILTSLECDPRTGNLREPLSTSRRRKALWNLLSERGLSSLVVNWPVQYPAESIKGVSAARELFDAVAPPGIPWTAPPDAVSPIELASKLAALCVHPTELTADDVLPFLPDFAAIDQKRDSRVRILVSRLTSAISAHAAATSLMASERWDFLASSCRLIESASTELGAESCKAVETAYRFSDQMLGRLRQLAGEDSLVIVVSASATGAGFFCIGGPGIKKDEFIHGATLLQIAPTILLALGCPVAGDMQRPLTSAFLQAPPFESAVASESVEPGTDEAAEATEARAWISRLEALGLRDPSAAGIARNSALVERERALNLASVYLNTGRFHEAAKTLEDFRAQRPEDETCLLALCHAHLLAGSYNRCRALLPLIEEHERTQPVLAVLRAFLAAADGQRKEALSLLNEAASRGSLFPLLSYAIGSLYLSLGKCAKAEAAFRGAIELDDSYWPAQHGRAAALRKLGRLSEAAEAVRAGLSVNFAVPESHALLGITLLGLGDRARALQAFGVTRALNRRESS